MIAATRWLAAPLMLAALWTPAAAQEVPGITKDTIKIGAFGPMTGPSYLYGSLVMNGIETVFDKVNAEGGVNGRKLVLVREDDRCEPAAAIGAVKKLIFQEQVFMIAGGGCSNAAIAAKDEVAAAALPWLIFAAVHDGLTNPVSPTIFTTALTASIESQAQVEFALSQSAKKIAVVSMRDSWGRSRYEPLTAYLKKKNVTIVADEEMAPDSNDATPVILRLRAAGADAVIMLLYPKPAAVFLRDAAKFAYKPITIGQTAIADPAAFEEQVGVPGATAKFVTISMVKYTPESPEIADWEKAVRTKYPNDRLSVFNLFGIGNAQVLIAALKAAGPNPTREGMVKILSELKGVETDVYGAPINCAVPDHRCNRAPVWISKEPGGPIKRVAITPIE
jgi:branched-chain amino acid transport system substrate-binding protein